MPAPLTQRLDATMATFAGRAAVHEPRFALHAPSRDFRWSWDTPGQHDQYFIASTTKLYATTIVLQMRGEGLLDLDASAAGYLPAGTMEGLHTFKGTDYAGQITVRQLMAHTSGLADFFEQKWRDGSTTFGQLIEADRAIPFEEVLRISREEMSPHFPPGTGNLAYYSDTNYQLLCAIIEHVEGASWRAVLERRVLRPIGLSRTWSFAMDTLDRYDEVAPLFMGDRRLRIPLAMASFPADGGMVSTTAEQLTFLEAFMAGTLFPREYLEEIQAQWRKVFTPLQYGTGIMLFELPWYYTFGMKVPRFVGHSGASGAVAFYAPELDLYCAGAVNQAKDRSLVYNLMTRLATQCQRAWK